MFNFCSKKKAVCNNSGQQSLYAQNGFNGLGNQSMLKITSQNPVIQRARYMRAIANEGNADIDITLLKQLVEDQKEYGTLAKKSVKKSSDEIGLGYTDEEIKQIARVSVTIKDLLNGYAGMATSLYIPGTRYIYPVGYQLEINENKDVLANFKKDGNTGTGITVGSDEGRRIMMTLLDELKEIKQEGFSAIVTDGKTGIDIYDSIMNCIINLKTSGDDLLYDQCLAVKKSHLNDSLIQWYAAKASADSYKGSGVKTKEEIYGSEVPGSYSESNINALIADVRLAWYDDTDDDHYDGRSVADSWKKETAQFLGNRAASAERIINKINSATEKSLPVKKVSDLNT